MSGTRRVPALLALPALLAWPLWALVLLAFAIGAAQTLTDRPILVLLGVVILLGVVLLADPWRVLVLSVAVALAGLVAPAAGHVLPGYWQRYALLPVFGLFAVVLAGVERRRVRAARRSSDLLHAMVEATDQPVFAKRFEGRPELGGTFELTNTAWARAVGVDPDEVPGRLDAEMFPPEMLAVFRPAEAEVIDTGRPVTVEQRVDVPSGTRTFLTTLFPLPQEDGVGTGVGGIATDVTERTRAEERLAAVFARSPVAGLRLVNGGDRRTVVLDANLACRSLLGVDVVGAGSEQLAKLLHPEDVEAVWALVDGLVAGVRDGRAPEDLGAPAREIRLRPPGAGERWATLSVSVVGLPDAGGNQELVVQFEDITSRKQAEAALTERALTDPVTGLPNRYALTDRLGMALTRLGRHPGTVCLLFCDLDRFKQVNDVFGHDAGDGLLREVAHRLAGAVRPDDTVGRLGGDEFVVVCEGFDDPVDAAVLAGRLQDRLRAPWSFAGHEFVPTASIGVAFTADPSYRPGDLLREADVAMYRAKDSGRDRIEIYDRSLDDELADALAMQQRLHVALAQDGFVLHYQPVVLLDSLRPVGAEALVRMRDGAGLLAPGAFLPHAEAAGLMGDLGTWVLRRALADRAAWPGGAAPATVGVNVSPTQLVRPRFAESVLDEVARAGLVPAQLVLEVTETALLERPDAAGAALRELHDAGVLIALDDFGTGYSSLSWLHQLPVDIVKLDKSFVHAMAHDQRRAVVVRAVVEIADETGLGVVAEGIETEQQLAILRELGCETGQGFLLGRPVPADDPSWAATADRSLSWEQVRGSLALPDGEPV